MTRLEADDNWVKKREERISEWEKRAKGILPNELIKDASKLKKAFTQKDSSMTDEQTDIALDHPYLDVAEEIVFTRVLNPYQLANVLYRVDMANQARAPKGVTEKNLTMDTISNAQFKLGNTTGVIIAAMGYASLRKKQSNLLK